jgi:hypothetical protein
MSGIRFHFLPVRGKRLWLAVVFVGLLAGCSTTRTYTPHMEAGPARPADYPIPLYTEDMRIPRPCEIIGELSIGDTQLTLRGGSADEEMKTLMATAHEKGADVVQIISLKRPDFESAHYRLEANLLSYADVWETVPLSEQDFLKYLQTHEKSLDPIEGVWTDGTPERIAIMRNTTKPGRDFIGFVLNPLLPSWQTGYKIMDIAHTDRTDGYHIRYFRDDFSAASTSVLLQQNRAFSFIINARDHSYEVRFVKLAMPAPDR